MVESGSIAPSELTRPLAWAQIIPHLRCSGKLRYFTSNKASGDYRIPQCSQYYRFAVCSRDRYRVFFSEPSYETSATNPIPSRLRFAGYVVCPARVLLLVCAPSWKGASVIRSRAAARPRRVLFCFNFSSRRSSGCRRRAGFEPHVSRRTQRSGRADKIGFTCDL